MKLNITKTAFASWLKNRAPNRKVGECGDATRCALACYLNDRSGRKEWRVFGTEVVNDRSQRRYKAPNWFDTFASKYDQLGDKQNGRVLPKQALGILKRA